MKKPMHTRGATDERLLDLATDGEIERLELRAAYIADYERLKAAANLSELGRRLGYANLAAALNPNRLRAGQRLNVAILLRALAAAGLTPTPPLDRYAE